MTPDIAILLTQDGLATGSIYVLLAVMLVLVFAVTRIVFVPQGDLVAFSALTLAAFDAGTHPGTIWILAAGGFLATVLEIWPLLLSKRWDSIWRPLSLYGVIPAAIVVTGALLVPRESPIWWKMLMTCAIITALGPVIYRVVFQPMSGASPLVLLIAAVATHFGLTSLGLEFFGAEGVRTPGFSGRPIGFYGVDFTRQSLGVMSCCLAISVALFLFFRYALTGKALLATAYNRRGAELVGISALSAGKTAFAVAGLVGAVSGLLIGPMTTLYYDSGFILGLKGFVGAIVGGLVAYPMAAAGAILIGLIESFASFWESAYRDVIVFTVIIPVLFWRSLAAPHSEESVE